MSNEELRAPNFKKNLTALFNGLEVNPIFWSVQPPYIIEKLGKTIADQANRANKLESVLTDILEADEIGQGVNYCEAMDRAYLLLNKAKKTT